jgi:hydrogenase maturation factor
MNQNSMLKTITTGILIVFSSTISGQEKSSKIETSPSVKTLIERKIEVNKAVFENQYYAIQLYYGNNTAANRILKEFKVNFPEWEAELSFETPNYKVRVGRFKDFNLASQKLEEIRKVYPSAFLLEPNNL